MLAIRIILLTLICAASAAGSSEATPFRHVVARVDCIFVMDPGSQDQPPSGIAYQATEDGFTQLWKTKGWYGFPNELFLAPDGMSLVRIERMAIPREGKKIEDVSVLFLYFKGKLVKEYKLSEVVKNMSSLEEYGFLGSRWMNEAEIVQSDMHDIDTDRKDEKPEEHFFRSYNHYTFRLNTLENAELFFHLLDGERIARRKSEVVDPESNGEETGDPFAEDTSGKKTSEVINKPRPQDEARKYDPDPRVGPDEVFFSSRIREPTSEELDELERECERAFR